MFNPYCFGIYFLFNVTIKLINNFRVSLLIISVILIITFIIRIYLLLNDYI